MRRFHLTIGDKSYDVEIVMAQRGVARVVVNGRPLEVRYQEMGGPGAPAAAPRPAAPAAPPPPPPRATPAPRPEAAVPSPEVGTVTAPMPGVILDVLVSEGTPVKAGDTVVKLEAMKMENDVKAPVAGVVKEIRVSKGANVTVGEILVTISRE